MPSRPDPVLDERFAELVALVRAARPHASGHLRSRVRSLAAAEPTPVPRRRLALPQLRLRLVLVPAVLVLVAAAAVGGVAALRDGGGAAEEESAAVTAATYDRAAPVEASPPTALGQEESGAARGAAAPAPARNRLQEYRAELHVRVPSLGALSNATGRAMRITRSLGGYVVTARYAAPVGEDGDSLLVVRVPVGHVQEAIFRFSGLGTIVSQQIQIQDLQAGVNRQDDVIARVRSTITSLEEALREPGLTEERRVELQARLNDARAELRRRLDAREATVRRGRLARISLALTTREPGDVAVPSPPGDFERTLRDGLGALEDVSAWFLVVLLVASPFLALAAAALLGGRRLRRRANDRLLERA